MPNDPAIPLLGIYADKTIIQKDTGLSMLTAALSQQPRHGSNLMLMER